VLRSVAQLEPKPSDRDALLARTVELAPDDAAAWLEWGLLALHAEQPEVAAERLQTALELDPKNPRTSLELGRLLLGQDDAAARGHLLRAAVLGRGTPVETEARQLLDAARGTPTPAR
jgi:Tfp pilus assembly protein PilF